MVKYISTLYIGQCIVRRILRVRDDPMHPIVIGVKQNDIFVLIKNNCNGTSSVCQHSIACGRRLQQKKLQKVLAVSKKRTTFASQFRNEVNAKIAQLVEHNLAKVGVAGSSPVFRSKSTMKFCPSFEWAIATEKSNAKIAQLVEHNLAKVGVAGSSPVFRSHYHYHFV